MTEDHIQEINRIKRLDHGFVRLVEHMGSDLSIARAARVSYSSAWRAGMAPGSDARLIWRLMRDNHSSPFEAVTFTFEMMMPLFVARQWHRHRTWAYNELSARYRELPELFYLPKPEVVGMQDTVNKQGRTMIMSEMVLQMRKDEIERLRKHSEDCFAMYRWLLERGWPRELARSALPTNTYTHMFGTVSLLNLFRFMSLRSHDHAQYEIRVYSNALLELAAQAAPVACAAWHHYVHKHWKFIESLSEESPVFPSA